MEKLLTYIDLYCERTAQGLLNEPLNFFSNIAFFVAGFGAMKLIPVEEDCVDPVQRKFQQAFVAFIFAVGVGSSLFHSFANYLTQLLDVIPIVIFVFLSLGYFVFYLLGLTLKWVLAFWVGMVSLCLVTALTLQNPGWNGSQTYLGILVAMVLLSIAQRRLAPQTFPLWWAALCFGLSLGFRTIDERLCDSWPWGTHFMWHLLNGVLIYLIAKSCFSPAAPPRGTRELAGD